MGLFIFIMSNNIKGVAYYNHKVYHELYLLNVYQDMAVLKDYQKSHKGDKQGHHYDKYIKLQNFCSKYVIMSGYGTLLKAYKKMRSVKFKS